MNNESSKWTVLTIFLVMIFLAGFFTGQTLKEYKYDQDIADECNAYYQDRCECCFDKQPNYEINLTGGVRI